MRTRIGIGISAFAFKCLDAPSRSLAPASRTHCEARECCRGRDVGAGDTAGYARPIRT